MASDVTVSVTSMANRGRSRGAGVMSRCRVLQLERVNPVIQSPETGSVPRVEAGLRPGGAVARQWQLVPRGNTQSWVVPWLTRAVDESGDAFHLCADADPRAIARGRLSPCGRSAPPRVGNGGGGAHPAVLRCGDHGVANRNTHELGNANTWNLVCIARSCSRPDARRGTGLERFASPRIRQDAGCGTRHKVVAGHR